MNETNMPLEAYIFVGFTALLLSYVTIMEAPATTESFPSATSMLPGIMPPLAEGEISSDVPSMLPSFMTPATAVVEPESAGNSFSGTTETPDVFSETEPPPPPTVFGPQQQGGKQRRTRKSKKSNKKTKSKR